jgi:hypothetical protein
MHKIARRVAVLAGMLMASGLCWGAAPFWVRVVDAETGRGVPLVELRTMNQRTWYTDSNGVIAISDPWLLGHNVLFSIRSDGYICDKTVCNYSDKDEQGTFLKVQPGARTQLKLRRENIAERLYRITGAGIYADSVSVGLPVPIKHPLLNGNVTGQDTVIAIPYHDRIYWFWGDTVGTSEMNFQVSGATSAKPEAGGLNPEIGIDLTYFTDSSGFSKRMFPLDRHLLVWLEGLMLVRNPSGQMRLVATYTGVGQAKPVEERGVAVFDDEAKAFRVLAKFPPTRGHRSSHPFRVVDNGRAYWYLYPNYRVPDDWQSIQDARAYEAFVCAKTEQKVHCSWKSGAPFVDDVEEQEMIEKGALAPEAALFPFIDVDTHLRGNSGMGSVAWNAYRKKWIMISGAWGDVYYSEADAPQGPWLCAKRIVHHQKCNFYNVVHHSFLDREGGRVIYFEGTYTAAQPTPLYDYNQIMYKLRLDDPRLQLPASTCVGQK